MIWLWRWCGGRARVRHRHHDRETRAHGARREPLVAVDHVVVAVAVGARAQAGGIRARDLGLGHREARADLARQQRLEPALLLLGRPELREDLHVAGVRGGAVEGARGQRAAAHDLAERGVLEVGEPGAVLRVGQEEVPEAERLRLALELFQHLRLVVRVARALDLLLRDRLGGIDELVHEALDLRLQQLHLVGGFEVHVWLPGSGVVGVQGRTLTLTAPDFLSEASAKPRATSSSGTRVGDDVGEPAAMARDQARRRREIGLSRRAGVAVRPDQAGFLEQQRQRIERDGREEQAEHADASARPDRVGREPQRIGAAADRLDHEVDREVVREASQAVLVGLGLAQHARRAERGGELGLVRVTRGHQHLAGAELAGGQRSEQPDGAGAEHQHALPGAEAAAAQAVHRHRHRLRERRDAGIEIGGDAEGAMGWHAHELGQATAAVDADGSAARGSARAGRRGTLRRRRRCERARSRRGRPSRGR